jgi:hypothetical protein
MAASGGALGAGSATGAVPCRTTVPWSGGVLSKSGWNTVMTSKAATAKVVNCANRSQSFFIVE